MKGQAAHGFYCITKKEVLSLSVLFIILLSGVCEAFVPKTPHLLYLVVDKIRRPVGIEAFQTKKIINYADLNTGLVQVQERLIYDCPKRFRSEVTSDHMTGFSVEAQGLYAKVIDGILVSTDKSVLDRYTDILLYRDYTSLADQLSLAGVDTGKVSYERYDDTVCYVIGAPVEKGKPFAGLWIQKDTLFPVKYVVVKDNWVVEILYDKWEQVSKTWYPMKTSIFLDDQLYAMVDVKSIVLKKGEPSSLFDIDNILRAYSNKKKVDVIDENSRQVEALDKSIKDFGRLYE